MILTFQLSFPPTYWGLVPFYQNFIPHLSTGRGWFRLVWCCLTLSMSF